MYEIDDKLHRPICKTSRHVTISEPHCCWCGRDTLNSLLQEAVDGVDGIHNSLWKEAVDGVDGIH